MAGDATIQAAIQTMLRETSLYADSEVSLGDARIMGAGKCAIIYPGPFESFRAGDWSQVTYIWTHYIDIWRPFAGDDYADIVSDRQTVIDAIGANPTLSGVTGLTNAIARVSSGTRYLWPRNTPTTSKPSHVGFRIEVQTTEERLYAGSGEFS